jgi:P-type Ca2+ transporter type 2C
MIPFERVLLEAASSKTKLARLAVTMNGQHYLAKVGSDWVLDGATGQAMAELDLAKYDAHAVAPFDRATCMNMINTWAEDGYRVICIVAKPVDKLPEAIIEGQLGDFGGEGFVFLGCLVIQDPPREDVAENIRIIHGAGVVVSMITGDNPITGMSIAKQIGLAKDYTEEDLKMCLINAFEQFHNVSEEDAKKEIIRRLHYSMSNKKGLIIGRVSPFQKRWFVEVAKAMGLIVAMTGDGANDAPALKAAHVGIAMGNGSDIAKAAGDMIMVNESFSGIVEAIRAGRLGFDNILKFLMFLLGTNISEVTIYLILTCANVVIVLDALNLLILNLLTDGFPAIALSQEKAEGDLMKRAPLRRDTSVLNKFTYMSIIVTNLGLLSSYFVVIFVCNSWYLNDIRGHDNDSVDDYSGGLEKTRMAFILLINIAELLLGFSHRAPDRSILSVGMFTGKYMNIAALSSIGAIIFMTHTPGLKGIMRTDYLDLKGYLLVVAAAIFPFIVHETAKMCFFVPNNFSVYALYQYEYEVRDAAQVLKDAEGEGPEDEDGTAGEGGGVETSKKTGQTNGEA